MGSEIFQNGIQVSVKDPERGYYGVIRVRGDRDINLYSLIGSSVNIQVACGTSDEDPNTFLQTNVVAFLLKDDLAKVVNFMIEDPCLKPQATRRISRFVSISRHSKRGFMFIVRGKSSAVMRLLKHDYWIPHHMAKKLGHELNRISNVLQELNSMDENGKLELTGRIALDMVNKRFRVRGPESVFTALMTRTNKMILRSFVRHIGLDMDVDKLISEHLVPFVKDAYGEEAEFSRWEMFLKCHLYVGEKHNFDPDRRVEAIMTIAPEI
jgi:hypothetical protein